MVKGNGQLQRARGERGTALVEASFALPVLLLLVVGFFELSGALRSRSTASHVAAAGGRMASVAGADPMADQLVLQRMARQAAGMGSAQIDFVAIWHAIGPGDELPPACRPASVSAPNQTSQGVPDGGVDLVGACNVYVRPAAPGGAFAKATDRASEDPSRYFGCQGPADPTAEDKLDCSWPAQHRRDVTSPRDFLGTAAPPDFVGIHVQLAHPLRTPFLPDLTYPLSSVHLIEPHGYEL